MLDHNVHWPSGFMMMYSAKYLDCSFASGKIIDVVNQPVFVL